ncbi:MAG: hypothetical protein QNJ69_05600 [Gammaproteobacteria bacterium]|nr:hypothetical protein [Gammaproteobacteria bacterium]
MKIQSKYGITLSVLMLALSSLAVAQEYVPPPTGPYQPSVVINRVDQGLPEQNRIYRFPPADLVGSAPLMDANPAPPREARIENRPPVEPPPRQNQTARRSAPEAYQQTNPQVGNVPANPQWRYNPYQYDSNWNNNPQAYPYAQGYQRPYPYGYNQYNGSSNNFFPGMPTPWTDNPMQQFFGN